MTNGMQTPAIMTPVIATVIVASPKGEAISECVRKVNTELFGSYFLCVCLCVCHALGAIMQVFFS